MSKKKIFPDYIQLDQVNEMSQGTLLEHLGIELIEIGDDYLVAKMPVDHRTKQPMGLLHGGASVALAESLGSYGAFLTLDHSKNQAAVGLEINTNHVKSAREGFVYGKATPIHMGKSTHIWGIEIKNEQDQLVAVSRLTMAILENKKS